VLAEQVQLAVVIQVKELLQPHLVQLLWEEEEVIILLLMEVQAQGHKDMQILLLQQQLKA
jgi:hypothetical protein